MEPRQLVGEHHVDHWAADGQHSAFGLRRGPWTALSVFRDDQLAHRAVRRRQNRDRLRVHDMLPDGRDLDLAFPLRIGAAHAFPLFKRLRALGRLLRRVRPHPAR